MSYTALDDLPSGYSLFRVEPGTNIALPECLAREAEKMRRTREREGAEQRREMAEAVKTVPLVPPPSAMERLREQLALPPVPGYHRVLPRLADFVSERDAKELRSRVSDEDVRKRHEALREQLSELGPDRRVGQPVDWRAAMDELEETLPNFAAPIKVLRNTLALNAVSARPVRIPPLLLLGPPGIGKTYFSQKVAEILQVPHAVIAFDQPSAGSQLRGSDKFWGNTESGLLFRLICMGEVANPVVLLDELDKSALSDGRRQMDPLAQLHGALEPLTASRLQDSSTEIEFDASLVTYVATANSLQGVGTPLLSRFEILDIGLPTSDQAVRVANQVIKDVLARLGLKDELRFDRRCAYVMARMSPRLMRRTTENLTAAAISEGRDVVGEEAVWALMGLDDAPRMH